MNTILTQLKGLLLTQVASVRGRIIGYLVAGVLAMALIQYVFHGLDGLFGGNADAATVAASQAQLALHPRLVRWRDKLRSVQTLHRHLGDSLAVLTARATARADSADSAAARAARLAHQQAPVESPWRIVALISGREVAECKVGAAACEQRAISAEREADSLAARLASQIKVRDHPCGFFVGLGVAGGVGGRASAGLTLGVGCRALRSPWP